jgi:hypothetical protein
VSVEGVDVPTVSGSISGACVFLLSAGVAYLKRKRIQKFLTKSKGYRAMSKRWSTKTLSSDISIESRNSLPLFGIGSPERPLPIMLHTDSQSLVVWPEPDLYLPPCPTAPIWTPEREKRINFRQNNAIINNRFGPPPILVSPIKEPALVITDLVNPQDSNLVINNDVVIPRRSGRNKNAPERLAYNSRFEQVSARGVVSDATTGLVISELVVENIENKEN